jgi:hypothetical protein
MPSNKKKKPSGSARIVYTLPPDNQAKKVVADAEQQADTVLANPDIANHPEVSTAANAVKAQAQTVDTTLGSIANKETELTGLRGQRVSGLLALRLVHGTMTSAVNVAAGGDKAQAATWGGKIATRTTFAATTDAPQKPTAMALGGGSVEAKCTREEGVICYLFQIGTDPAHLEAWPPPVIAGGCKHTFAGLTPGQKVYVRIAIVRRGGVQGKWSIVMEVGVT